VALLDREARIEECMPNIEFRTPAAPELLGRDTQPACRLFARRTVHTNLNVFLIFVVLGGTLFQLFAMPSLFRALGIPAALLLLPIMLLQPLHWGLIHEGIHSRLLRGGHTADFWARVLSIVHWLPFDATQFCHLVHHRHSRHAYDRADVHDGNGAYAMAWLRYRGRLLGGVYLEVLGAPLLAFLPVMLGTRLMENAVPIREAGDMEVRQLFVSLVKNVVKRRRTRREFALTLALYGASAWAYGAWWPMLLASMCLRGIWHSLADNAPHHDVLLDEPGRARNYALPAFLGPLVMNHHLHLTHHHHPTAPWTALPRITKTEGEVPRGNYFRAVLRQLAPVFPRATAPMGKALLQ
jgi:fatty acid desaturase